jgi:hypothetical protein
MDTKTLIKNLRTFFSKENKIEKKYTKVWLNGSNTGTGAYIVNVQYDNPIAWDKKFEEQEKLKKLILEKIEGSAERVRDVGIHYFEEGYYRCRKRDILVYDELYDPHLNYYSF